MKQTDSLSGLSTAAWGRRGVADSGLLMWIIALAVLTIIFAFLAYTRYADAQVTWEGDEDDPHRRPNNSLVAVRGEISNLKNDIRNHERRIDLQREYIHRLDLELSGLGAYWSQQPQHGGWLLGDYDGADELTAWQLTRTKIAARAERLARWNEAWQRDDTQRLDELDALVREFQNDQQRVLTDAADLQARFEQDRESLMLQLDRYAAERREVESQHNLDFSSRAIERLRLDQEIRELLDLRLDWLEDLEPDATVVRVDLDGRYLIINRGSADGIKPGLKFEVFTYDRGSYVVKGLVEVVELGTHIATCRILEEEDRRHKPLHPGDMVANPVFNAEKPKVFHLAGEFS
ncbi:MAG: hypothetical protein EA402_02435, partial [Planctomycetota bacterium]